jgi:hypothetical protein
MLKVIPLVALLLVLLFSSTAEAIQPSGNWSVNYFTVSNNQCTNTPYTPLVNGLGGFGDPSKMEPLVSPGTFLCVHIHITGGQAKKQVLWKLEGIISPMVIGSTDSKGSFDGKFVIHIPQNLNLGKTGCIEPPERVDYGSSVKKTNDYGSGLIQPMWSDDTFNIDHIKICRTLPPMPSVPEFPLGLPVVFLLVTISMVVLRKKINPGP